ncbi:hypothetical protein B0H10DRAFT_2230114 [Mycena sp. CBHHK59/15]|nr:hypothetical protein B0H10DRAFT_2230114 [Mycena sp. CBHHK59/15]
MFFNKALLATAMLIGAASTFTGTATLGFTGTTNCGCPMTNSPFAVSSTLVSRVRCNNSITLSYNSKTTSAIFNGIDDSGDGTGIIHLSSVAFAVVEDNPTQTMCSPVTWAFTAICGS